MFLQRKQNVYTTFFFCLLGIPLGKNVMPRNYFSSFFSKDKDKGLFLILNSRFPPTLEMNNNFTKYD